MSLKDMDDMEERMDTETLLLELRNSTDYEEEVDLEAEDMQAAQETMDEANSQRPKNTQKAYTIGAQEFTKYCLEERKYKDGDIVTGTRKLILHLIFSLLAFFLYSKIRLANKLNKFLKDKVLYRNRRTKSGKTLDSIIGKPTVKKYISGVIDLYKQQVAKGQNAHSHPGKHPVIVALKQACNRNQDARMVANNDDRHKGSLRDGYITPEAFEALSRYFFLKQNETGLRNRCSNI